MDHAKPPLTDKQDWITAFEKTGGRAGRPSCGASHVISWSSYNQAFGKRRSLLIWLDQFVGL